ncbi:MAG: PTS sugar transporter subunit IIB [Fervidicoccaceae archaeon]
MPVKLIRIDDRYIHGQVTVAWVMCYSVNEIWVVDGKI